jgi:hypothetical protein
VAWPVANSVKSLIASSQATIASLKEDLCSSNYVFSDSISALAYSRSILVYARLEVTDYNSEFLSVYS